MKALYKVIGPNGEPLHGGSGNWPLPKDGQPGEWREETGKLRLCFRGLHLVTEPARWWQPQCRIFAVEAEGIVGEPDGEGKVVCRRVRLLREITDAAELAALSIFVSGDHDIGGQAVAIAWGSATVRAWGSATVEAWGSAIVISWVGRPDGRIVERVVWIDRSRDKPQVYTAETSVPEDSKP